MSRARAAVSSDTWGEGAAMGPVFIAGASRSGKTLMRWMLSSHSRIAIARRAEMWPRFYARFGDLARPENFERCLRALLGRRHIAALVSDPDRLRRDFWGGAPTYARLFALVYEQDAHGIGKTRWGDQSAFFERFAGDLLSAYPGAKVIHMIRDPRDRHHAILDRGARRAGAAGASTISWLRSVALAKDNAERHPNAYKLVRYETLVASPQETIRDVCAFLGEKPEPQMLRMERVERYRARSAGDGRGPISTSYIGRYRGRIGAGDVAFIQSFAGRQMLSLGYRMDPVRLTLTERIHHAAFGWPLGVARMGSWRARTIFNRASMTLAPSLAARS